MPDASHVSVLLEESVAALALKPAGTYVDATFGRGGHTRAILGRLSPAGRLVAIDRDPDAARAAVAIRDARLTFVRERFSALDRVLDTLRVALVDGVLLDLGISSPQIDTASRGFSFRLDGPLDMRMSGEGPTAAEVVAKAEENDLADIIFQLGEERHSRRIARAICAARVGMPIRSTKQLADIVARVVRSRPGDIHPACCIYSGSNAKSDIVARHFRDAVGGFH